MDGQVAHQQIQSAGNNHRWALVLAAGDGTRLQPLTAGAGRPTPKQFCSLLGGRTLLEQALERAGRNVPKANQVSVVAAQHQEWWRRDLRQLPPGNVVVQPKNRGTAAGILLPLLEILQRDPEARLLVLPSDHFVADERVLSAAIEDAFEALEAEPERVFLLGISPDDEDGEYGWILPRAGSVARAAAVETFVEKPGKAAASALRQQGAVWNSFLFVAKAATLLELFEEHLPELVRELDPNAADLSALYQQLESSDFSRQVLEKSAEALRLVVVPPCGWSDLGTPERVLRCLEQHGRPAPARRRLPSLRRGPSPFVLASALFA